MIELIPDIDLINGQCVRLTKGDYDQKKVYNDNPAEVAKQFEQMGFKRLQVILRDVLPSEQIFHIAPDQPRNPVIGVCSKRAKDKGHTTKKRCAAQAGRLRGRYTVKPHLSTVRVLCFKGHGGSTSQNALVVRLGLLGIAGKEAAGAVSPKSRST